MRLHLFTNSARRLKWLPILAVMLAACGQGIVDEDLRVEKGENEATTGPRESVFGEGGFTFGGNSSAQPGGTSGIGVNAYLWRATLDTVSVWPVASADPFGGVVITDWHAPAETPDERFKMNVYILDRALRADGVRVSVFRQVRDGPNGWRDAAVNKATASRLEDAILTRARQFRHADSAQN
jgi:hypothetical protein